MKKHIRGLLGNGCHHNSGTCCLLEDGKKTLYRLAAEGSVPGFKVGGSWRFRRSEIEKWILTQEKKAS